MLGSQGPFQPRASSDQRCLSSGAFCQDRPSLVSTVQCGHPWPVVATESLKCGCGIKELRFNVRFLNSSGLCSLVAPPLDFWKSPGWLWPNL